MKYYIDYDRCLPYADEWLTEIKENREEALDFCNHLKEYFPECSFRIIQGVELHVEPVETVTKYAYKA